jgi:hypothetical protein
VNDKILSVDCVAGKLNDRADVASFQRKWRARGTSRHAARYPGNKLIQEEGMLKPLIVVGAVLFAASAFAQGTQNQDPATKNAQPQAPAQTNVQGQQPVPGKTMQEKDTGLMNQSGGAPGATGSTGTQSGTTPNTGSTAK